MKYSFFILILLFQSLAALENITNEEKLLSTLSLREKIGQLCIVAAAIDESADHELIQKWFEWQPQYKLTRSRVEQIIKECQVGGVVFYGHHASPKEFLFLTQHYQSLSKIPLLITLDAEWGLGSRLDTKSVMKFPQNLTLGAIKNQKLIYEVGYEVGKQLKFLGVHVNFAPVVDINSNPDNPVIGVRSFGSDKVNVALAGIAYMQGLQDAGIIACAKHFPGHGDVSVDSHLKLPCIEHSREHLNDNELYPFKKMVEAGIKSVMTAHLQIPALEKEPGLPSTLSKVIVTDILQNEIGFKGIIFTDALGMKGVSDLYNSGDLELKALQAGHDVLVGPLDVIKAIDRIEKAVHEGEITEIEIDKKVLKVLTAKKWALDHSYIGSATDLDKKLNSESAQKLLRQLYQKAITCVKCSPNFLSTLPDRNAVVINTDPELTDFEDFLKKNSSYSIFQKKMEEVSWSEHVKAPHVIICVSKKSFESKETTHLLMGKIADLKAKGRCVTVLLFCSPYFISPAIEADNVIFAYEPAEQAQIAAAEMLCAKLKPEGVLAQWTLTHSNDNDTMDTNDRAESP